MDQQDHQNESLATQGSVHGPISVALSYLETLSCLLHSYMLNARYARSATNDGLLLYQWREAPYQATGYTDARVGSTQFPATGIYPSPYHPVAGTPLAIKAIRLAQRSQRLPLLVRLPLQVPGPLGASPTNLRSPHRIDPCPSAAPW